MAKENKKDQFQNLPDGAREFINKIIKKMRYRRKVTKDVKAELVAHFEDELKDLLDGREKDEKARQIICEFGDIKLLAVLLRRAKKRCRPLWRTIIARSFQAAGVLILCLIFYVIWFLTGKPAITTNYVAMLNNLVRPVADESTNAAPYYKKATESYRKLSDDFLVFFSNNFHDEEYARDIERITSDLEQMLSYKEGPDAQHFRESAQTEVMRLFSRFQSKEYNELTAEQKIIAKKWLQEHEDTIKLVVEGSQKPYCWQNHDEKTDMLYILLTYLSEYKQLLYTMRWKIGLSTEEGRFEEAFEYIKASYRLGRHLRGDKILVEQYVGISIEAATVASIRDIIKDFEIDSKTLGDFQQDFEKIIADEDFRISFKAERMIMLDEIQRCFTSDRFGKGHLYLPRFREIADITDEYYPYPNQDGIEFYFYDLVYSSSFLFTHPNKEQTLTSANELFELLEYMSLKNTAQLNSEGQAIEEKINNIIENNRFIDVLCPASSKILMIADRDTTEVEATLTLIALIRYEQDKGRYPEDLDELLGSGYIKKLPLDRFSNKPLVYKKTGNDFLLYSFGPDCTDNSGKPGYDNKGRYRMWADEDADAIFWPEPGQKQ